MNFSFKAFAGPMLVLIAGLLAAPDGFASKPPVTNWKVSSAAGLDALLLIGAASGDVMQSGIYVQEIEYVRKNIPPEGLDALQIIDETLRQRLGQLTGPTLALYFSANSVESINDVIATAADPEGRIRPGLEQSIHWDPKAFAGALRLMPAIHTALKALKEMGYQDWYQSTQQEQVDAAIPRIRAAVEAFDIIPEQSRLLGRELDSTVEIFVVAFAKPYGIRILGQRFITWYGWDGDIQLRNAAHEIFHPPYDPDDAGLNALLADLENDPWMQSIVENHDPKFGYNSFGGIVNEDSTQALDQIVSERLGFAQDAGRRWSYSDGGMHMLAAALYHAMLEDGFADSGGVYSDWLKSALKRGLLSPDSVRRRAAEVVGQDKVEEWSR